MDATRNTAWQLTALSEALGDLTLTVEESLSIGRGKDNDVVLGSKQVSRNHALLSVLNGKLYIKDLESSNGTFVNDQRIEANKSKHLNADDKVAFAAFVFSVSAPVSKDDVMAATPTEDNKASLADAPEPSLAAPIVAAQEGVTDSQPTQPASTDNNPVKSSATDAPASTEQPVEALDEEPIVLESVLPPEPIIPNSDSLSSDDLGRVDERTDEGNSSAAVQVPVQPLQPNPEPSEPDTDQDKLIASHSDSSSDSSTDNGTDNGTDNDTAITNDSAATKPTQAPVEAIVETPAASEVNSHTPVSSKDEHDKTTSTELQREADPEVLKAKQAATSQLSGTANLGQAPDVGTYGNNAVDQALNNPATHPAAQKKASGGWFIWVFLALIILGIALWLFNMGPVK